MYRINDETREIFYGGGADYKAIVTINGVEINQDKLSKITISNPLFDITSQTFSLGQFVSQQVEIYFNDTTGIDNIGEVELSIGVRSDYEDKDYTIIPIGKYIIDTTNEDYYNNKKLTCLDYAIKMKTNCDYSELIVSYDEEGKQVITPITIERLLQWLCTHYGIQLGTYPTTNKDYKISVYDNTLSGKYYVSQIAELMGGNAIIGRDGKLNIIPIKQQKVITRDATQNETWEYSNKYIVSAVEYNNGVLYSRHGNDANNTLYIRSNNMFVLDDYDNLVKNIYNAVNGTTICSLKTKQPADLSLDRWDLVEFDLDGEKFLTYNNNNITYEMSIMSEINTQIPTKTQESTTNRIETNEKDKIRKLEVTVNQQELELGILAKDVGELEKNIVIENHTSNYPIELQDAGAYDLQSNVIYGNSEQDGTPTPDSPIEVKTVKGITNLFDIKNIKPESTSKYETTTENNRLKTKAITNVTGGKFFASYTYQCKKNTDYTISIGNWEMNGRATCAIYVYKDKLWGTAIKVGMLKKYDSFSFNSGDNTSFIVGFYQDVATNTGIELYIDKIQVEQDTTPHTYVPYGTWLIQKTKNKDDEENTALIDMNIYDEDRQIIDNYELCSIGDIKDTFENGVLTKRIGKVVLNGSENWSYSSSIPMINVAISDLSKGNYDLTTLRPMSNKLKGGTPNDMRSSTTDNLISYWDNTSRFICIKSKNNFDSVATAKTWLSNNNVTAYYILNTPETYNLNYTNLSLFQGYNHISLESDINPSNMEIDYLTDSTFNEQYVNQSQFTIKTDEISSEVSKSVSLSQQAVDGLSDKLDTNTYDNFYKTEYTKFVEDSNSFQMEFDTTYKNKINETENNVLEIKDYIRFENGNIILSGYEVDAQGQKTPVEFEMRIEKDRIGIYRNGALLSSWVQNVFEVEQINMGNFAFIPRANGSLSFRKVK